MYVKKYIIDYSVTIVEGQMDYRSKAAAHKIVEKLEIMNGILKTSDKGFEKNTLLRDSFIKMNEKTIECLTNGSLILNDYDYQSTLSLAEINVNMNAKEKELISYYQELRNYEKSKKTFGTMYDVNFKNAIGKNILEYNAYQNFLFYKINVIDQKLMTIINSKDKKGFLECFNTIATLHKEAITKTNQSRCDYKDNWEPYTRVMARIFYETANARGKSIYRGLIRDQVIEKWTQFERTGLAEGNFFISKRMIVLNPKARINASEALKHAYFNT